jgi:MFS family permease
LLAIQAASSAAIWMDVFLIFSVPSFAWGAAPSDIALLAACLGLPSLLLGPVAGAVADRLDVRRMVLAGALARTVFTAAIAFAPDLAWFAALAFLKGMANLLYFPASAVVINRLVPAKARLSYFSLFTLCDQLGKVAAPLLAGVLALYMNAQSVFLLSAAATAACLCFLRGAVSALAPPAERKPVNAAGLYADVRSGLLIFPKLPFDLRVGVFLSLGASLSLALYDPHLAAYLSSRGFQASVFSWVVAATALGASSAAALVRFTLWERNPVALRALGLCCFAAALLATAIASLAAPRLIFPALAVPLWFLNGFGYEMLVLSSNVIVQNLAPPAMIGRIVSSVRSLQMTCAIAGPGAGAMLIASGSRETPFLLAAVLAVGLAASSVAGQVFRRVG